MNIAVNSAVNDGKKVAIFDLEMSREQLMQRALSSLAKVPLSNVLKGKALAEYVAEERRFQYGILRVVVAYVVF